jgi:hypothetical protein
MAATVHYGGAGTTGAGLRSGIPSIIIPFGGDQYRWARVVAGLGVAPKAPSVNKLTAASLASAIRCAINDQDLRARAVELAPNCSEIRLLPEMKGSSMAHCTLPGGGVSKPVQRGHRPWKQGNVAIQRAQGL